MNWTTNVLTALSLALLATATYAQATIDSAEMGPPPEQTVPVADDTPVTEDFSEPELADDPDLTDEERLGRQFERFRQLMNDKVYDEADAVAKRVVELAMRTSGPRSNDAAKALTNLAIVQHHNGQYEAAMQNFQTAVDIIEDNEDRLNGQLINPLKGLGAAQLESGRPDLASGTFRRAVHVTHVTEGPHNLDQVAILESLAETDLRLGALDAAKQVQDRIYAINVRAYAKNEIDLIPALMRRAAWQHRAGFIFDERTTYRRAIRIIEAKRGKNVIELVEPLLHLGKSFFYVDTTGTTSYQPTTVTTGEIYFKRAVRISKESPESTWQVIAATTLALGDYYMYQGTEQRARKVYRDVWNLLSADEERYGYRRKALEELVTLRERPIPQYISAQDGKDVPNGDEDVLQGRIAVTYVISSRGRATNVKVLEADPPEFEDMLRNVQREMRRRIYRPQFDETGPVASPVQVFTHRFYYRQSDLDKIRGETAADEQNDEG